MSFLTLHKFSHPSKQGWEVLEKIHPAIFKVFTFLVLPLSFIPPAMLYHAGSGYGDAFYTGFSAKPWGFIAVVFFLGEMITFAFMGWLIKQVALANEVKIDDHDAYLLAAIAPVPLWFSALGLFVPSLLFNAIVSAVALALSCGIIYQGVYNLCHMHEEVTAASITQIVIGSGLIAWCLLLLTVISL